MPAARILLALGVALTAPAQDSSISSLVRTLRDAVTPDQAMDDVRRIWETDRWFTFPKFACGYFQFLEKRGYVELAR